MDTKTNAEDGVPGKSSVVARVQRFLGPRLVPFALVLIAAVMHNLIPQRLAPDRTNALLMIAVLIIVVLPPVTSIPKHMQVALCLLLLTAAGFMHSEAPGRFWPTVALLGGVVFLIFLPEASRIFEYVSKVKIKDWEFSFNAAELNRTVELAESNPVVVKQGQSAQTLIPVSASDTGLADIIAIAARDKKSALMRLALEIEKEVESLYKASGLKDKKPTDNYTVMRRELRDNSVITREVSNAIREFWRTRNKVVHPEIGNPSISDAVLGSTVDSGIRVLRLLKEIPRAPSAST
jgi:hypothetical protein